jgi:hypothetical protein
MLIPSQRSHKKGQGKPRGIGTTAKLGVGVKLGEIDFRSDVLEGFWKFWKVRKRGCKERDVKGV